MSALPPVALALTTLMLATLISGLFLLPFLILLLDAYGRHHEYREIRWRIRYQHPPSITWILRRQQTSYCGRWAAVCACEHEGMGDLARMYYRALGYRWYHIFPDGTFTKRCPFIKPNFWVRLVGGR